MTSGRAAPRVAFYNNPKVRSRLLSAAAARGGVVVRLGVRAQRQGQSRRQAHRQRVRLPRHDRGLRHQPDADRLPASPTLSPRVPGRPAQYAAGSAIGILFATILGFLIGIARLSSNGLLARFAGGYVELIRNLPLLFQILFWYLAVLGTLPEPRQSIGIGWQPVVARAADAFAWLERYGLSSALARWCRSLAEWIGPPELFLNNRGLIVPEPVSIAARIRRRRGRARHRGGHWPAHLGAAPPGQRPARSFRSAG